MQQILSRSQVLLLSQPRKQKYTCKSAGISIYFKEKFAKYITVIAMKLVGHFGFLETEPVFSDGHCTLSHFLYTHDIASTDKARPKKTSRPQRNESRSNEFCGNLNLDQIDSISFLLDCNLMLDDIYINEATECNVSLISNASNRRFPVKINHI